MALHNAAVLEVLVLLLFLWCWLGLFACWGDDVFDAHVDDEIAVMLHVMHVVDVQHAEFGHVGAE
jgi:hypothetical protein